MRSMSTPVSCSRSSTDCSASNSLLRQNRLRRLPPSNRSPLPEYVEPMVLARRGLDAPAIAARCGITLGEAELLVAMARGDRGTAP